MTARFTIMQRTMREVNTDPQRRCYHGAHAKSELQWSAWDTLEIRIPDDRVETRLKFWRELNDYAVSKRGQSAKSEFRAVPEETLSTQEPV